MIRILAISLFLFILLFPLGNMTTAVEINNGQPVSSKRLAMQDITVEDQRLSKGFKGQSIIDDLLGPEDHFPFLPDNHRDSGTGKFNWF